MHSVVSVFCSVSLLAQLKKRNRETEKLLMQITEMTIAAAVAAAAVATAAQSQLSHKHIKEEKENDSACV